jgi:Fe-S cluster biosynthesis and repair protein YggX
MVGNKLTIEMGRFTGQMGLQVYEQLKSEVDKEWNALQQTQLTKSSKLRKREALMERVVVKALHRFLSELPARDHLEGKVKQSISDEQWNQVVGIDRALLLEELRAICGKRGLKHTGDKKELAWRLLGYGETVHGRTS